MEGSAWPAPAPDRAGVVAVISSPAEPPPEAAGSPRVPGRSVPPSGGPGAIPPPSLRSEARPRPPRRVPTRRPGSEAFPRRTPSAQAPRPRPLTFKGRPRPLIGGGGAVESCSGAAVAPRGPAPPGHLKTRARGSHSFIRLPRSLCRPRRRQPRSR